MNHKVKLGEVCELQNGFAFKSNLFKKRGHPIIRITNINNQQLNTDELVYFDHTDYPKKEFSAYKIFPGDLLIAMSGATTGKVGINTTEKVFYLNQRVGNLKPKSQLDKKYLFYILSTKESENLRNAVGAAQPNLSSKQIKDISFNLPPLDEQRRITKILGTCQRNLQNHIKAINLTEELLNSTFLSIFGSPKTNPNNYTNCKIGDIANIIGGSQPPKSCFSNSSGPEMVRLIQIRDFKTNKYQTYVPKKSCRRFFTEEDIMIGRYGPPVFQIFRGLSGAYNVALMKAEPKGNITKNFLFFLLKEKNLQNYVIANSQRTSGQSGVNLETLLKYPAFIPPQKSLIRFDHIINIIYRLQNSLQKKLSKQNEIFLSLQNQLIN